MICTVEDDYLEELYDKRRSRWEVILSNGCRVYQDDDRPGLPVRSAWLRLKAFVESNRLSISEMMVRFRSNIVRGPANDLPAYYFARGILAGFGGDTYDTVVLGGLTDEGWRCWRYTSPDLVEFECELFTPKEDWVIRCQPNLPIVPATALDLPPTPM